MRYEYDTRVVGGGINYPSDDHPFLTYPVKLSLIWLKSLKRYKSK